MGCLRETLQKPRQVAVAARAGESHRGGSCRVDGKLEVSCKKKETGVVPGFLPGALGTKCQVHSQNWVWPMVSDDVSLAVFQVNEIYHDESLGAHINVVLVRIILLGHAKVSPPVQYTYSLWNEWGLLWDISLSHYPAFLRSPYGPITSKKL